MGGRSAGLRYVSRYLADERNEPPRNNMMTDVEVAAQVDRADCFIEQRRRE
jgi:hypothetical protein